MAINTKHFKKLLQAKEQDLAAEITRQDSNARDSRTADVEDPIDEVTSSEAQVTAFEVGSMASETLSQVRAALQRIETGDYGVCIDCGRQIEEKRLEAVPWTSYCLEDQEKHDKEAQTTSPRRRRVFSLACPL